MLVREYLIIDIDTKMVIQETTRKDILGYIDEHLENIKYGNDMSDYAFRILYRDGSEDEVIGNDYDGHKIKRINILAVVVDNPCNSITFGNYEINNFGVVNPAIQMKIHKNIMQIGGKDYV